LVEKSIKDEFKEAIIKALSHKIVDEIKDKKNLEISIDKPVVTTKDDFRNEVIDYLVRELAETRIKLGIALKMKLEEW
jgi:hypothetical protein